MTRGKLRHHLRVALDRRKIRERLAADTRLGRLAEHCRSLDVAAIQAQPIAAARFVVIDTETTGLHAYAGDEIVSIALLEFVGLQPTGREFERLVNPGRTIPAASTRIHGITDADVADAPPLSALLAEIGEFVGEAVVVGHHVNFDLRFLNRALQRLAGCSLRNPWLDTMLLYTGETGRMGHYTLEDVARACGVAVTGRHTARGDAQTAAQIFAVLAARSVDAQAPVARLRDRQYDNDI